MPSFTRALTFFVVLPIIVLTVGCTAADKHVYYSTVSQPTSVALVDTYLEEEVWSIDIPVNHRLSLDFEGNVEGQGGSTGASSSVAWQLHGVSDQPTHSGHGKAGKLLAGDTVDLTGKRVRIVISYRKSPELPGTIDAAPVSSQETAESVAAEAIAELKPAPKATEQPSPEAVEPAEAVLDAEPAEAEAVAEEAEAEEVVFEGPPETQPTK